MGASEFKNKDLRCYMTEIQLQAILDAQGDPTQDLDLDMMTTKDSKRISKFSLEAMTIGEEVDKSLTKLAHEFNSDYVGMDSVFPLKSGAPKYSRPSASAPSVSNSETSTPKVPDQRRFQASEGPTITANPPLD